MLLATQIISAGELVPINCREQGFYFKWPGVEDQGGSANYTLNSEIGELHFGFASDDPKWVVSIPFRGIDGIDWNFVGYCLPGDTYVFNFTFDPSG
jgi:hypothetical protein